MPMVADSRVRLQEPAAQMPGSSWHTTRSAHLCVEGVAQAWANGRPRKPEPAAPSAHVDPPDDGRLAEVEGL
eukprot:8974917-Alexandrium_andersonii.AAC.1